MAMSDLAIVTPSVTMNEVWYMQIPFIAIEVASNQRYMTEYLKLSEYLVLPEFNAVSLFENIVRLIDV